MKSSSYLLRKDSFHEKMLSLTKKVIRQGGYIARDFGYENHYP